MKGFKKSFKSRNFKMGGYQTLVMVIVIVLVVVLNLVVGKLNITVDLSSDKKFTLTEESIKYASEIKDEIKMYYMCQAGSEASVIEKVLEQYDGLGNIKVVDKDPVVYPTFAKQYTEDEIQNNDVIVVNETNGKSKLVPITDMYLQDMDYTTYTQTNTLDAEGQLTSALQSVTAEAGVKLYYTSGHNEVGLDGSFSDILKKSNIAYSELATASEKSIPEDCGILLMHAPGYDINEDEYKMISEYLKNGGKAIFFLNASITEKLVNYDKLLAEYGVDVVDGYVVDAKGAYNPQYPTMLVPTAGQSELTSEVGNTQVIMAGTKGMVTQSDVRSTLTVEPLFTTTDSAYSKTDMTSQTIEKEKNDIEGPFNVAVSITDTYTEKTQGAGKATEIVVLGSGNFAASDFIATNQYGNRSVLLKALNKLSGGTATTLAIPTRSLDVEYVAIQKGDRVFFTTLLVVILPLALLGFGFAIWYKRRKN